MSTLSIVISQSGTTVTITDTSSYTATRYRTIGVKDSSGNYIDIGSSNQVYKVTFNRSVYKTGVHNGASIAFTGCDIGFNGTIPTVYNDASFDAMITSLAAQADAYYSAQLPTWPSANWHVTPDVANNSIVLTYREPGIPGKLFTGGLPADTTLTLSHVATQNLPDSSTTPNEVSFTMSESGSFTARLSVFKFDSDTDICDGVQFIEGSFVTSAAAIEDLNNCFLALMSGSCGCGCNKCASKKATEVRNKLEAVTILQSIPGSDTKIAQILDSALSDCESINCGCND